MNQRTGRVLEPTGQYRRPVNRDVVCRSCGAPMPGRDGEFVLKYFHLRNAGRSRREKGKQR